MYRQNDEQRIIQWRNSPNRNSRRSTSIPPFDVGADFSMDIEIGGDTFTKKPNILEEIAYRDTWGKGADSFIAMIYERLVLMRDLLAEDGKYLCAL
jgi:hypothetical protein